MSIGQSAFFDGPHGATGDPSTGHRSPHETRPYPFVIEVPWPRFSTVTPGGRASKSRKAGRRMPWLNMNTVNNLHRRTHQLVKIAWREEAFQAAVEQAVLPADRLTPHPFFNHRGQVHALDCHGITFPVAVTLQLFAPAKRGRDVAGIIEGVKPVVDGFVEAGLLVDDTPEWVRGFTVLESTIVGRKGNAGVRVTLTRMPV